MPEEDPEAPRETLLTEADPDTLEAPLAADDSDTPDEAPMAEDDPDTPDAALVAEEDSDTPEATLAPEEEPVGRLVIDKLMLANSELTSMDDEMMPGSLALLAALTDARLLEGSILTETTDEKSPAGVIAHTLIASGPPPACLGLPSFGVVHAASLRVPPRTEGAPSLVPHEQRPSLMAKRVHGPSGAP